MSTEKLKLRNSNDIALVDSYILKKIQKDKFLQQIKFLERLKLPQRGYAVAYKSWSYREPIPFETLEKYGFTPRTQKNKQHQTFYSALYLHRVVANLGLRKDKNRKLLAFVNKEQILNCKISNIVWVNPSEKTRLSRFPNQYGYKGVSRDLRRPNCSYLAHIMKDGKYIQIGKYKSPEEAALAYNEVSLKLYGKRGFQNIIRNNIEQEDIKSMALQIKQNFLVAQKPSTNILKCKDLNGLNLPL